MIGIVYSINRENVEKEEQNELFCFELIVSLLHKLYRLISFIHATAFKSCSFY